MAVEARRYNVFPPQTLSNRGLMMNAVEGFGNIYDSPMGYGVVPETVLPFYGSGITESVPAAAMKSDSGLTYAVPVPVSRKRSRDATFNPLSSSSPSGISNQSSDNCGGSLTFLGEDFSFQFQQQQLEIDRFIAQHTEKVRLEVEERRRRYSRRIAAAVEENVMKRLKAKEEEIQKIGKLNFALEERVKSLCFENQIWRDLAQTNEATANALRSNLEQVLAQVHDEHHRADDAQSCCGSNFDEIESRSIDGHDRDYSSNNNINDGCIGPNNRMCRSCGKEESRVLLLPCRHLCLCTRCGSSLHTCPVCHSSKTASVHINLSAS